MADSWGYKHENGPGHWHKNFPVAEGCRQSPVDIVTSDLEEEVFPPVLCKYPEVRGLRVINTGSSWKMDLQAEDSSLTGGALTGEYQALQMHAHWGSCSGKGSEHTVNGKEFDAEFHIVHFNTKYGTAGEAVDKPDGLAVLGIFIKEGKEHPEFAKMVEALGKIKKKGEVVTVDNFIDPDNFLPENKAFFTYEGSLTTPPLLESVIWTVFKEPIEFSEEQLNAMRSLLISCEDCEDRMVDNYRPPCPLGQRKVKAQS
jgi:carbonic anhydrase 2